MSNTVRKKIEEKFKTTVRDNGLLNPGDRVIAGFSGGPDSMALVYLLKQISNQYKLKMHLVYFNHQLRGAESKKESEFVRSCALRLDMPLTIKKINPLKYSKENKVCLEEAGRLLRYKYFEKIARTKDFNVVAVGHQLDDQAETVLFNIIRGSSLSGLKGIPVKRPVIPGSNINVIRPLSNLSKNEIEEYLQCRNAAYVCDSSNKNNVFSRNFIRNKVMKDLEKINPGVRQHLKNISDYVNEFERFKSGILNECIKKSVFIEKNKKMLDLLAFFGYDRFLQKEVIKSIRQEAGKPAARREYIIEAVAGLNRLYDAGVKKVCLRHVLAESGDLRGRYLGKTKFLERFGFDPAKKTRIKELGLCISGKVTDKKQGDFRSRANAAYFDWNKVNRRKFYIDFWKSGLRFGPFGMKGTKKLSDYFNEKKVPEFRRDKIPLVFAGRELIWVAGYRTSEKSKVEQSTKRVLELELFQRRKFE